MSRISSIEDDYYVEDGTRYVFIDGHACETLQQCYTTLEHQLSLPDYFGRNLDAFQEVINDLEWIKENKIKIIISGLESLLVKEPMKKEDFLEILNTSDDDRLEIIYLGTE